MRSQARPGGEIEIISGRDIYDLHEAVKAVGVDLLMGNSHGKCIADDGELAFARVGFPVYDRVQQFPLSYVAPIQTI